MYIQITKTIYFLILNEIVEYFIKIVTVCLCKNIHITIKFVSSKLLYIYKIPDQGSFLANLEIFSHLMLTTLHGNY